MTRIADCAWLWLALAAVYLFESTHRIGGDDSQIQHTELTL